MCVWLNLLLYLYYCVVEGGGTLSVELGCHSTQGSLMWGDKKKWLQVTFHRRLFVYGRSSGSAGSGGSAGSAFCFPYNSVTVRRILFKFGRFMQ